ncbi:uncharacterized protein C10orf143 homolog isoform X1 [Ailuropoda melanoleuca]|uniref:uncharacterized protein C10orf143 homolog isoform X1 n=1 Tax=Ailuropoda melanoleuca TaxID=9646 RepID=UPI001494531C|nr:uncharacterized protein C10orf143 homolog isoform X1 [Ailuropoda melanoleuca]
MMTWDRGPVLPRRLWSPPRRLQPPRGQAQAVLAPPPSLIGSHGTRGGRRRGHSGLGRRPPSGGDERPADSGLGPYGHAAAGPVATAEGGGASGSGGRETGMQESRSRRRRVGLRPRKAQHPGVLDQRGAATCGDPSERWKELSPALPEMYCGGVSQQYSCVRLQSSRIWDVSVVSRPARDSDPSCIWDVSVVKTSRSRLGSSCIWDVSVLSRPARDSDPRASGM